MDFRIIGGKHDIDCERTDVYADNGASGKRKVYGEP
jgi:hypothetical protein